MPQHSHVNDVLGATASEAAIMRFNPDRKTVVWERLEQKRIQQLGLNPQYSRYFNVTRSIRPKPQCKPISIGGPPLSEAPIPPEVEPSQLTPQMPGMTPTNTLQIPLVETGRIRKGNSVAPFCTEGKPTCGYYFSRGTDNKKKAIGIPPSDLVKWRSFIN